MRADRAVLEAAVETDLRARGLAMPGRLVAEFHTRHVCRVPGLDEMLAALRGFGPEPHAALWEAPDSPIHDLDLTPSLPRLTGPVLVTCGRYDFATPETVARYAARLPAATYAVFEESSHHPHLEERAAYLDRVRAFLAGVDAPTSPDEVTVAVADVWRNVLGRNDVGLDDTFAGLGGTTFSAARVQARLRATGTGDCTAALAGTTLREVAHALHGAGWRPTERLRPGLTYEEAR
jgi:hypothetical protein